MNTLRAAFASAWSPHDRRAIHDWAHEHVPLPDSVYALGGPFDASKSRYLLEPFAAIADDRVRIITVRASIQTGKSLIGDLTACWTICNRPQNLFWNFPTDEHADHWARRRAMPLFENVPAIREKFSMIHRYKKLKNEIHFGPMWIVLQGANLANLQSYSVPFIINEELWEWEPGLYLHALGRTTYFQWRSKVLNLSQAGAAGDDLDQAFTAGSQEQLHFACPECRFYQPFEWNIRTGAHTHEGVPLYAGVAWDTSDQTKPAGQWNYEAVQASAHYICQRCRHRIDDRPAIRRLLNDTSRYIAANPNAPREQRSFHWNALACDQIPFGFLVGKYLRAKEQEKIGDTVPLREFYQKYLALPFDPQKHATVQLLPTIELGDQLLAPDAATPVPITHEGIQFLHRFGSVDVQYDHWWMLIQAWSAAGDILTLWAGKLYTWGEVVAKQKEFGIPNKFILVDIGHRRFEVIVETVRQAQIVEVPRGRAWSYWYCMEATDREHFLWKPTRGPEAGRAVRLPYSWPDEKGDPCIGMRADHPDFNKFKGRFAPIFRWSKPWIMDIAIARRDGEARGRRFLVKRGDWNDEFSRQLHSQKKKAVSDTRGQQKWRWHRIHDDHLLQCFCQIIVRAFMMKIIGESSPD